MKNWNLNKGETVRRKDFHKTFGGSGQGGINPSNKTPNIFIFSNHDEGQQHGYLDRWDGDFFLYVGEGQTGNQKMIRGNKAILNHVEEGRSIRLFWGSRGEVEYGGEFEIDHIEPWTTEQATSKEGKLRNVILFRLREVAK
jgi:hypothetical protein